MPFKQMPPDLTDFNNWFASEMLNDKETIDALIPTEAKEAFIEMLKQAGLSAWNACSKLHAEYLSGELARIEAERQSE